MRLLLCCLIQALLLACNSSGKKDPNKEMDDTARMRGELPKDTGLNAVFILASAIPASIKVKGTVHEVWKWKDSLGENFLITTHVAAFDDKDPGSGEEGETAELYAYHFAGKGGRYKQVWTMHDAEKACPFDITCNFIPGSVTITDLDKDGIAETKVQYAISCRSDVSPAFMRLLMYENTAKYTLQGSMWLPYGPDIRYEVTENDVNLEKVPKAKDDTDAMLRTMGRYENEKSFTKAPPEFLRFARAEWMKYSKEKLGE